MSPTEPDIGAYNQALVAALRSLDPAGLRRFAVVWGERLANRALKRLASATNDDVEKRLWMMIIERPDLADLHPRAVAWLEQHGAEQSD